MDEAALLAAVCAHPEEVTPRLAYADYLLEQSEPEKRDRGEFILAQCRLAEAGVPPGDRYDLRKRERELYALYHEVWAAVLAGVADTVTFHRGFPDHIGLSAAKFPDLFGPLAVETPVVRVRLQVGREGLAGVAGCEDLSRLSQLDLGRTAVSSADLRELLNSPHLSRLTYLSLSGCPLGDAGAEAVAESPILPRLRYLALANTGLTPTGVSRLVLALAGCEPPALRWLNLRNNALAPGNWVETVLAWLPRGTAPELRMSLESQLARYRLAPPPKDPGPLPRLRAVRAKLPSDLQFWLGVLEDTTLPKLAAALRANPLPREVHEAFAAVCTRRLEWWTRHTTKLYRAHNLPKEPPRLVAPANAATDREALAGLLLLMDSGDRTPAGAAWLRDWLLRLYERHTAGALDPEGRTR